MKILVVGSGGREHALLYGIRRESPDAELFCAPGNAGTSELATNVAIPALSIGPLVDFVRERAIDLTVVGPEAPLAAGLADRVRDAGFRVFGPSAKAAEIEASKAWAKDVMHQAGVPTAASATFTALEPALRYIDGHAEPLVVKASGLAGGKGAVVCQSRDEARAAARAMMAGTLGSAGETLVIEAFLEGEELSVLALTNGEDVRILPPAQDHKRLLDGDRGPNTGGMGAYSPVAIATAALLQKVQDRVLRPTLAELDQRGATFTGVLYAGLMIDPAGDPHVIEFNCRFGDPETQVIVPRIQRGLLAGLWACAAGEAIPELVLADESAVTTVLAARGYPDAPEKGATISIPANLPANAIVFHAGTRRADDGTLRVDGGRVLAVTGVAESFEAAQETSRRAAQMIEFEGKQFRSDIGWRETERR